MEDRLNYKLRDYNIDILRAIGSLLVILAHVRPPEIILNFRSFDVILLVFISGMTLSYSNEESLIKYLTKRIKRLVIPTYITITVIFLIAYMACNLLNRTQLFDINTILESYIFFEGIGYIWIVKVYLLIAIMSPIICKIVNNIENDFIFILIIIGLSSIYYWMYNELNNIIVNYYIFYMISYSIVAMIGLRCRKKANFVKKIGIFSILIFSIIQIVIIFNNGGFTPTEYKYPPQIYYLSYGISISCILYILFTNLNLKVNKYIVWISKNSFNIYLAHIIVLLGINMILDVINIYILEVWVIKFVCVSIGSITLSIILENITVILKEKVKHLISLNQDKKIINNNVDLIIKEKVNE